MSYGAHGGKIAERAIVVGQRISLEAEDVELHRERRAANREGPDVEIAAARLEGLECEQGLDQP